MNHLLLKRVCAVVLFLALAFAGDRLLSLVAANVVAASQFRLSQLYRGSVDADILIIGNSRGVHSLFAPRLSEATCRRAFNAAYNGVSLRSMSALFEDYLERNRKPMFALIEISATSARDRSTELKTFAPLSKRLGRFFDAGNSRYRYWSRVTHLYHFNTELFLRCLFYMRRDDQDWVIEGRQITESMIREYRGLERTALGNSRRRSTTLQSMAAAARQAGVQPIFFIAPYHPVVFDRSPEIEEWLRQQRVVAGDVPFLDFSHLIDADAAFADPVHLNKTGSYRLIDALLKTPEGRELSRCGQDH